MTLLLTTQGKDIAIDPEDWPRCDKCNMPVENFCVTDTGDALIFVAACHEKQETVTLSDEIWDNVLTSTWSFGDIGPAFTEGD